MASEDQNRTSVYSGMSGFGLLAYFLDKHILSAIILLAVLCLPGCFFALYFGAKNAALQKELLEEIYVVLSSLDITFYLGWTLAALFGFGIVSLRSVYKKEIHRLSESKNQLLEKLGVEKGSSGHTEMDFT